MVVIFCRKHASSTCRKRTSYFLEVSVKQDKRHYSEERALPGTITTQGQRKQNFIDPAISLILFIINNPPTFVYMYSWASPEVSYSDWLL